MKLLLFMPCLVTIALARGQMIDKPAAAEDLSTQLSSERAQFDGQIQVIERVTKALRDAARGSAEPRRAAAVVHAEVLGCLTTGDHKRALSRLYGKAAAEAGRIAAEWEIKAKAPTAAASPDSQQEFTRQIAEGQRLIDELRHKANPTPEDRDEMSGLTAKLGQLRKILSLFDEVVRQADPSRYARAAVEMREKELIFQRQAEGAELQAAAADMECRAGVVALRSLRAQEDIEKQLSIWQRLPAENGTASPLPVR